MGMLVNSYHPTESWAEVAAEAHLLVKQRSQRPPDPLKDESRHLPEARPNPGALPDNDLGPGQYTFSEALTSKTPCVPRIVKGDRFAKAGKGFESQMIDIGPDAWAESLSSRPLSPASMRQTGSSGFEAGSTQGRSFPRNWRTKIQRPHHELVAEHQPDGELPILGEAAIPPGMKAKRDNFIRRRPPGLQHSHSAGSLVRGNPRSFKSDRVDMSMLSASSQSLPSPLGLELHGSPAPGSPKKGDLEKAKKRKKKKRSGSKG